MRKIIFILLFVSISCWSQKAQIEPTIIAKLQETQYLTLDSLLSLFKQNNSYPRYMNLKSDVKHFHRFLGALDIQKKYRQTKNENQETILELQVQTILNLMKVYSNYTLLDSLDFYHQKIIALTKKPLLVGESYENLAAGYAKNGRYLKAVKSFNTAIDIYENSNIKTIQYLKINVLVHLTDCLIQAGSLEYAKKNVRRLSKTINKLSKYPKLSSLQTLVALQQAYFLITSKKYSAALEIITAIDTTTLDGKVLLHSYNMRLHDIHRGLGNYILGEHYLEKAYRSKNSKRPLMKKIGQEYFQYKLDYAILNNNSKNADYYYDQLEELLSSFKNYNKYKSYEVLSRYYVFKNNFKKAYTYSNKALFIKKSNDKRNIRLRLDLYLYSNQLDKKILKMEQAIVLKDEILDKKWYAYMNITISVFFGMAFISLIILYFRKEKKNKLKLEFLSRKTIVEAKQAFLENMSHEIRTPITSIIGYLTLLQERSLDPNKREKYLNIAFKNSKKMIGSLNSFLTLLRLEKGTFTNNKKMDSSFNFFLKEIVSFYMADLEIKSIKFYYKSNMLETFNITFDLESLKIIFSNLISNAIKYSSTNTAIYLAVNFTETNIQISIKDNGFGIAEDEKEKIFSRFYQANSNTTIDGFGIGLSLVSELVKKLNGTLRLETEINVGSVFYIDLPYELCNYSLHTKAQNVEFELLSINDCLEDELQDLENFPKVLIVDDNVEMIAYLKELFMSSLDCTFAFNGQEALAKVKEETFEVIISDLRMPIMDGVQLKEALNKMDGSKDIPFILITSVFNEKLKYLKTTIDFNEYIEKPFTKDEIMSRVQFVLERSIYRKKISFTENTEINFDISYSDLIEKIKESILSNLTNTDFNVNVLAQMCGYEQRKLNEILKSKLGLSTVSIILEVRLLKAYELIIKNRYPTLNEVIYAVGMNSRSYFNKKFEVRFGLKAGELRKKNLSLL